MTVQVTWDDDAPIPGLPDEGEDTKQYDPTPAPARVAVDPEPVGSVSPVVGEFSVPLVTVPDVTSVEAGGTVTVSGSGLAPSSAGTLSLVAADGTALVEVPVTADAVGAFTDVALAVPAEAVEGDYTLTLTGGAVVVNNVTITVGGAAPVDPVVEPDVTEVEAGGTVTATGADFPAATEGTVGLYDTAGTAVVEEPVTTDDTGAFAGVALVVPEGTEAGDLALRATVGDAVAPDVTVTVTEATPAPTFAATPDTVDSAGDEAARTVTASGTGFGADATGRVAINTADGTEVVGADATVDAAGVLPDTPLIVPEGTEAGDYAVHAAFDGVTVDDVALTVTATPAPADPEVTPDVTTVEAGGTVTVAGTGFPASTAGRVGLFDAEAAEVVGADVTTDAEGAFTGAALVVPAETPAGDLALRATFGDVVAPDVTVTVTAAAETEAATAKKTTTRKRAN